jgi:hypothetical protein
MLIKLSTENQRSRLNDWRLENIESKVFNTILLAYVSAVVRGNEQTCRDIVRLFLIGIGSSHTLRNAACNAACIILKIPACSRTKLTYFA